MSSSRTQYSDARGWNRSSAFAPEQLAVFTEGINEAVASALRTIESDPVLRALPDDAKAEARALLVAGVVEPLAHWIESLKKVL
jgi:hypothetical protein